MLLQGRLYSQTSQYRRREEFARSAVEAMFDLGERFYVSLSFGKQSIVVADMVYAVRPETEMFFLASSESYLMHDFEEVIDRFMTRRPVRLTIVQTNNAALDIEPVVASLSRRQPAIRWQFKPPGDPAWNWKQSRDYGENDLQEMLPREGYDGWFWGLAKDESKGRRITLSARWPGQPHPAVFRYSDGRYRCCPLMNWSIADLAAYIAGHELPLLDAYRQRGLEARTTARVTRKAAEHGFMSMSRHYNINCVNRLCARFPELRGAT